MNEVKRQAVSELQKAVAAAEQKASELVAAERSKMERSLLDAKKTAQEEALAAINQQEESSEVSDGYRLTYPSLSLLTFYSAISSTFVLWLAKKKHNENLFKSGFNDSNEGPLFVRLN